MKTWGRIAKSMALIGILLLPGSMLILLVIFLWRRRGRASSQATAPSNLFLVNTAQQAPMHAPLPPIRNQPVQPFSSKERFLSSLHNRESHCFSSY